VIQGSIPEAAWSRRWDEVDPIRSSARPPLLEALSLLPVAWRVGSYIYGERSEGREPIFDLSLPLLEPPTPGPSAGVPLGGLGGGCIGRGWRGEFDRWTLSPGRYIHRKIKSDQFYLRVKRGNVVHTQALSLDAPLGLSPVMAGSVTYHGLHPRSWTVFEEPVPGVRITIRQLSPFLPQSYSEASLPCAVFHVDVENTGQGDIEASVMLAFQNGYGEESSTLGGFTHRAFQVPLDDEQGDKAAFAGVLLSTREKSGENSSYAIAADCRGNSSSSNSSVTQFKQFVIDRIATTTSPPCCSCVAGIFNCCPTCSHSESDKKTTTADESSMKQCISLFGQTGELLPLNGGDGSTDSKSSKPGQIVGAAVCLKNSNIPTDRKYTFSFALSWDKPWVRFGESAAPPLPRFYTRWFGTDGNAASCIASLALKQASRWEELIEQWQQGALASLAASLTDERDDRSAEKVEVPQYLRSQLFNELYFLSDGGTVWTDSSGGLPNSGVSSAPHAQPSPMTTIAPTMPELMDREPLLLSTLNATAEEFDADDAPMSPSIRLNKNSSRGSETAAVGQEVNGGVSLFNRNFNSPSPQIGTVIISAASLDQVAARMAAHDVLVNSSTSLGDSSLVGQFLYLEGHEYAMYNTTDVHFYASFALLQLWPHLEHALQRDVAAAVTAEDKTERVMMGTGLLAQRKVKGRVPHDMGSPSGLPWSRVNSYNFQDVSSWRDLGPKFVLASYRNVVFSLREGPSSPALQMARELYPTVQAVMTSLAAFDVDDVGIIENSGYPDQTYDIWACTGVSAYSGGLYIASLSASAALAELCDDAASAAIYSAKAERARGVYMTKLWTGSYIKYDSSTSTHNDSIMADMMCGQWWTRVCGLPPVLPSTKALQCFQTIYSHNVVEFAKVCPGRGLSGAVNGMRPDGKVDNSCLQSREVWTGTTYALAAAMLEESFASHDTHQQHETNITAGERKEDKEDTPLWASVSLTDPQRKELRRMAFATAQGIHDAGWKSHGYWFNTPEAWTADGSFRSLGYMRPLAIWALQFAARVRQSETDRPYK